MAKIFTITAATAIVGVALYAGAGYVAVPYIVKIALERTISQSLHRQIQLSDVSFEPWTWRLDIADLKNCFALNRCERHAVTIHSPFAS